MKRIPTDGDFDRTLCQGVAIVQALLLAGSIAVLAAAGGAVRVALKLFSRRDRKQLRELLEWHDESLAEAPPVRVLASPWGKAADRPPIAA